MSRPMDTKTDFSLNNIKATLSLKGHSQLVHMRITYHYIANSHIAEKTR